MTQSAATICPHLGLTDDRTVTRTQSDAGHRCYVQTPPAAVDVAHQTAFCLTADHPACPFYAPPAARHPPPAPRSSLPSLPSWLRFAPWIVLILLLVVVGGVYGRDLFSPAATPTPIPGIALAPDRPDDRPTPTAADPVAHSARSIVPTSSPSIVPRPPRSLPTSTPEPGGQALGIMPKAGDAGWWSSGDARGNRLGDSYLYAGYFDGQAFIAAFRFDLSRIPRGAAIRQAMLRLTGLRDDRLNRSAGGQWNVQILAADALKDFGRADFQALLNAPAAVTLLPTLFAGDLQVNRENISTFDPTARAWLQEQIARGATTIIVRIVGPTGGESTLFAWDSGSGPATLGAGPVLNLALGPAPATPPPLPSQPMIIATLTPTPANILTVAADRLTATAVVRTIGAFTPLPYRLVTPTPTAANLATAQALGVALGRPPIVIFTPTPANEATAAANAAYATAVAVTTGTFTPVPTNAVTPIVIAPTPQPENVVTAAAQALAATALADRIGAATPLPFGALIATITPRPPVLIATPTPANYATVAAHIAYATAVALTTGTFTPVPRNAVTPTPPPSATPLPLLLYVTPLPSPTPTPTPPAQMPAVLFGKILFWSDRGGAPALYLLDPADGAVALVTQSWPYSLAMAAEPLTRDGRFRAFVRNAGADVRDHITGVVSRVDSPQIFVEDREYRTERQLTTGRSSNYDPAWSPTGDRIAYVSTEPGNDEIFTIGPDGSEPRRLTYNNWEWDKHPTWSPDGRQIVFYSNRDSGRRQLWIMDADGKNQRLLLPSVYNDWDPVWVK